MKNKALLVVCLIISISNSFCQQQKDKSSNKTTQAISSEVFDGKKIIKSEEEWKKILTSEQYRVARKKGTEYPYSSTLNENKEKGIYYCTACKLPLFSSENKFESGTGWPSFWKPIHGNNVVEKTDRDLGTERTEVVCARCDSHLGHVFKDGPEPTGLRYCMNGVVLEFKKK